MIEGLQTPQENGHERLTGFLRNLHLQQAPIALTALPFALVTESRDPKRRGDEPYVCKLERPGVELKTLSWKLECP